MNITLLILLQMMSIKQTIKSFFGKSYPIFKNVLLDFYGCEMNHNNADIIRGILNGPTSKIPFKFSMCNNLKDADIVLVLTCAIRENTEDKI